MITSHFFLKLDRNCRKKYFHSLSFIFSGTFVVAAAVFYKMMVTEICGT